MRLSEFPSGETLFFDSNCLIYHFTGTYPSCAVVLDRARRVDVPAATSLIVLWEVRHRLMMLEATRRFGQPLREMPRFLKSHPEMVRELTDCERAMTSLERFRIRAFPVTTSIWRLARRLSLEFGLLTTDAVILATMRHHRLTHLASNDRDFLRIPGITVWRP